MNIALVIMFLVIVGFFTKWAWEIAIREYRNYSQPATAPHDDRHLPPPLPVRQSAAKHVFWFTVAIAGSLLFAFIVWKSGLLVAATSSSDF